MFADLLHLIGPRMALPTCGTGLPPTRITRSVRPQLQSAICLHPQQHMASQGAPSGSSCALNRRCTCQAGGQAWRAWPPPAQGAIWGRLADSAPCRRGASGLEPDPGVPRARQASPTLEPVTLMRSCPHLRKMSVLATVVSSRTEVALV